MAVPLSVLYRNLAGLHRAGIGWPKALETATAGAAGWGEVRASVSRGEPLSKALASAVPPLDVAAVRAAESSGRFEEIFASLAERHESEKSRSRERKAAFTYPIFLSHLAALIVFYIDARVDRPVSGILWAILILAPIYAFLALSIAARRAANRSPSAMDVGLLSRFRSRAFIEESDARSLRALGWLHDAGVSFTEAVPLAARAGAGGRAAADLADGESAVRAGAPLSTCWRRVPDAAKSLLTTGESTGSLAASCRAAAEDLESSASLRRKRFAALAPPVIMLASMAFIGWRIISFYSGYFDLVKRLSR